MGNAGRNECTVSRRKKKFTVFKLKMKMSGKNMHNFTEWVPMIRHIAVSYTHLRKQINEHIFERIQEEYFVQIDKVSLYEEYSTIVKALLKIRYKVDEEC